MKSRLYLLLVLSLLFTTPFAYSVSQTTYAQQPSDTQSIVNSLTQAINRWFITFSNYMFELDEKIGVFIQNHYAMLLTDEHVAAQAEKLNDVNIKYTLTGYAAYKNPFLGKINPQSLGLQDEADSIKKYLSHLHKASSLDALLEKIKKSSVVIADKPPEMEPDVKDSFALIQDSMDRLYCNSTTYKNRCTGSDNEYGSLCEYEKTYLCAPNKTKKGINVSDIQPMYEKISSQRALCKPSDDSDKKSNYACSSSNAALMHQKLLQMILQPKNPISASQSSDYKAYKDYKNGDNNYNADSLLNTLALSGHKKKEAQALINYINHYVELPTLNDPSVTIQRPLTQTELTNMNTAAADALAKKKGLDKNQVDRFEKIKEERKNYINKMRQLLAVKDIFIRNFYYLYSERTKQASIAKLKLKDTDGHPITSALQLKVYLAKQALTPEHLEKMSKISPYFIARQQLFVLSAIRNQLVENQLLQERLLATLSLMGLQGLKPGIADINSQAQPLINDVRTVLKGGPAIPDNASDASGAAKDLIDQNKSSAQDTSDALTR